MLERDGRGLNLTEPVRDGILRHTGSEQPMTLEGRVVRLVDRVAYINHDIDDAIRAGILLPADLPEDEIELLGPTGAKRIDTLVRDMVSTLARGGRRDAERGGGRGDAAAAQVHVRARVPGGGGALRARAGAAHAARACSSTTWRTPRTCPRGRRAPTRCSAITDWIAGMTDRYCIATFRRLALPEESRL